jgi:hypothetical protein
MLIKAHIIPESFYAVLLSDSDKPKIYPTKKDGYPKRSPKGVYDDSILCRECDNDLIGIWDHYAHGLLSTPLEQYGEVDELYAKGFYEITGFKYEQLQLFFLSLLWRAHVTTQNFFSQVALGPWADQIATILRSAQPDSPNDLSVVLIRFYVNDEEDAALAHLGAAPVKSKGAGLNFYQFRLADYAALIKVDKRSFPTEIEPYILRPGSPLRIRLRNIKSMRQYELAQDIITLWN